MRREWMVLLSLLASSPVLAQTFPEYIEKQIRSGAITRQEAKLLYGSSSRPAISAPAPTLSPPPKSVPLDEAALQASKKPEATKPKEPPFRGAVTGLQTTTLTAGTLTGMVYLLQNSSELQEQIKQQQTLVASLQRQGARPPKAIGDSPVPTTGNDGTLSRVAAARAQVSGYETIATGANVLAQGAIQAGKFGLQGEVESGLLMVIVRGGERIIGVWSTPINKDQPVALDPGSALYWVP